MKSIFYFNTPCHEEEVHCRFLHHKVHRGKLNNDTDGTVLQVYNCIIIVSLAFLQ